MCSTYHSFMADPQPSGSSKSAPPQLQLCAEAQDQLPFHSAANVGYVEAVLPEDVNGGRMSALHLAATLGDPEAVRQRLSTKADLINIQDENGNTPLHLAVLLGHKAVARVLVVEGAASLYALNKDNLMPVSYCQDGEMFQALLSGYHGSSFNDTRKGIKDDCERTILHYAAQYATDCEDIAMLISGTDADQLKLRDSQGDSFFHVAAKAGNMEVLKVLEECAKKSSPPNGIFQKSQVENTLYPGFFRTLTLSLPLLEREIDSLISETGPYALLVHSHREFFDKLAAMGKVKISPRHIIEGLRRELQCAKKSSPPNVTGRKYTVPGFFSHTGELKDNPDIEGGVDDLFAKTLPTYLALYANKDKVFEFLLETTRMTVNQWDDKHKRTCLHWAVVDERKDIVEKLCQNVHLRPSIEDVDGKTALQHAFEQKNHEVMGIMRSRPAFKDHEEELFRDREVYVQALNAILVGAAVIAGVTFAGWLQLPSGAVFKSLGLKVFWVNNSLSFYTAVATMCVTIGALIPTPTRYVADRVNQLRVAIVLDASLLALSLAAVTVAFAAAGFAALRPSHVSEYEASMRATTVLGGILCTVMCLGFVLQLYRCVPSLPRILLTLLRFLPWPGKQIWERINHFRVFGNLQARIGASSRFDHSYIPQEPMDKLLLRNRATQRAPTDPPPELRIATSLSNMKSRLRKLGIPDKESSIKGLHSEK